LASNQDIAKRLLQRGADIDHCNRDGKTALGLVCQQKLKDMAVFLIENGADPHIEDLTGKDACDYARHTELQHIPQLF